MTPLREHTSHEFEAELKDVQDKLLAMGHQVDQVLEASGRALAGHDLRLANEIILSDRETDSMELEIDQLCFEILARRQPVASDLRLLTSALKMVVDLERIGDLGVSIAERVLELDNERPLLPYDDLLVMLNAGREMVAEALASLTDEDVARASSVIDKDSAINERYVQIFNDVVRHVRDNPSGIAGATRIQAISKYIERIGDHATNIAERVIFVLTGQDIRHMGHLRGGPVS